MTLKNLLTIFGKIHWQQTAPDTQVHGVTADSREVKPGFVFVAVRGVSRDGHDFLESAVKSGAGVLTIPSGSALWELPASNMNEADWDALRKQLDAHEIFRDL